jgi:hypothetical protein
MAGYDWMAGMSNNAVVAHESGKMTATQAAKWLSRWFKGCKASHIKACFDSTEWHHTGKFYNQTGFYERDWMLEELSSLEKRRILRREILTTKINANTEPEAFDAKIEYVEWGGSRNYPRKYEYTYDGKAYIKGQFIYFEKEFKTKKKIDSKWITSTRMFI